MAAQNALAVGYGGREIRRQPEGSRRRTQAILERIADFFDIFDLSFVVSGATTISAFVFWSWRAGLYLGAIIAGFYEGRRRGIDRIEPRQKVRDQPLVTGALFDRAAMGVGVVFGRLPGVVCRVEPVAVRDMRVMGGLFVVSVGVVFGSFAVVSRSMLVMFSRLSVVFSSIVLVHRNILFLGEMRGLGQHSRLRAGTQWDYIRGLL